MSSYVSTGITLSSLGIKAFTGKANYAVNVSFDAISETIERYQNEEAGGDQCKLNMNPDFQRGHVWTDEQQSAFVEFLLRGGKAPDINFNCTGWMQDFRGPFVIVDGLQRITAIQRFQRDEIKAFGKPCSEFDKSIFWDITVIFRVNNLKTRQEVLTWYLEMNSGGTPHTQQELDRVRNLL